MVAGGEYNGRHTSIAIPTIYGAFLSGLNIVRISILKQR
jgi:hypothetical protein